MKRNQMISRQGGWLGSKWEEEEVKKEQEKSNVKIMKKKGINIFIYYCENCHV